MLKHKLFLGVLLCVFVAGFMLAADKPATPGVGKTHDVTLHWQARVGNLVLPAGDYRVQHVMEGDKHIMVFTNSKGQKSRLECTMVKLERKSAIDSVEYTTAPNGERILTAMTFRGETFEHKF
jgi:hypothetical protein